MVESATVPPVDSNMPGLSLYRSPSKMMPSLPSHTPHKAGRACTLACAGIVGAIPSKPVSAHGAERGSGSVKHK